MKTCSLCKKQGHNRRTCNESLLDIPTIVLPQKVNHSQTNSYKSNNGTALENYFIKETGIKKTCKESKPYFINEHGLEQEIDFDFVFVSNDGQEIFIDITTSYRSDRAKQKGYNAILLKSEYAKRNLPKPVFLIGVGNLVENGKEINPTLIEGIDDIVTVKEIIETIKSMS